MSDETKLAEEQPKEQAATTVACFHPQYEQFFDRTTGIQFSQLGASKRAGALISSMEVVHNLVSRGFVTWPQHTGGGWYLLSNGERVRGADDALEAEIRI